MKTKGQILPCGGTVTFVSSTGYYFTPKGSRSRQWVATVALPQADPDAVAALIAESRAKQDEIEALAAIPPTAEQDAQAAAANAARKDQHAADVWAITGLSVADVIARHPLGHYPCVQGNGSLVTTGNNGGRAWLWNPGATGWKSYDDDSSDSGSNYGMNTND
jgi:hypothetical protein